MPYKYREYRKKQQEAKKMAEANPDSGNTVAISEPKPEKKTAKKVAPAKKTVKKSGD
ncbi:hypothetical protein [Sporosarcina beigongshangi]|uniref:hypothetical protein n=1 Tax=Sporosarcina beigongshangi TaxID=2782538 RepID=UPI00193949C6|nr:hypothetical protein [Sporosarcina beigongshangi]